MSASVSSRSGAGSSRSASSPLVQRPELAGPARRARAAGHHGQARVAGRGGAGPGGGAVGGAVVHHDQAERARVVLAPARSAPSRRPSPPRPAPGRGRRRRATRRDRAGRAASRSSSRASQKKPRPKSSTAQAASAASAIARVMRAGPGRGTRRRRPPPPPARVGRGGRARAPPWPRRSTCAARPCAARRRVSIGSRPVARAQSLGRHRRRPERSARKPLRRRRARGVAAMCASSSPSGTSWPPRMCRSPDRAAGQRGDAARGHVVHMHQVQPGIDVGRHLARARLPG